MAFGVLRALRELKIKVPENIGLAGFDDISFASVAGVPLTTVHIPIEELAVKVLICFIKGFCIERS